ncbi:DsbA family oxidoreductase [Neomegalonema sp.]|uniref:DsbA family oxidoreductase n=1 Tax=Neomegalonema sp. TaxID=2039713 RepID=UPI00262883B9|nr:DsbA family oxidoreductase [Neomegalonema sp.]MDD2869718.1 DsbA family oxidoreductase [Neomegalonema sp.]
MKIDVWSDVACPWCYLGKRRLEAALARFAENPGAPKVEVEYHSFQLAPDLPPDHSGDHDAYLSARYGWTPEQLAASNERLESLGAPLGIVYDFARNRIVNTHKAHELLHFAKAKGLQAEVKEALLRRHFSEGGHVGRIEELVGIAAEVGLNPEEARAALEASTCAAAVEADKALATRYGISGVPFFVFEQKYALSGAQEIETFLEVLEKLAGEEAKS